MWSQKVRFAIFLIIGVYLGESVSAENAIVFAIAFLLSFFVVGKIRKIAVLLALVIGVLGYHYAISESVRELYPFKDKYVTAFGKVVDIPDSEGDLNFYIADVRLIYYKSQKHEVNERIRITSRDKLSFGDSIQAKGFMKTYTNPLNSGDFDNGRNNKIKGIYFKMYADEAIKYGDSFKSFAPDYLVNCVKYKIINLINQRYAGDEGAILRAVFTGNKKGFSEEFEDVLYESNTMRLFYPAYIHIMFILSMFAFVSSYVKKSVRDRLLIIALCLYAIFNVNMGYIVKSALLMAGMVYSKKEYGYSDYKETLAMVITVMVIVNPLIVYDRGVIISTMSGLLIYYFTPIVTDKLTFIKNIKFRKRTALWIVLSVGMMPVQAYIFNCITPYSFWLNFLYIPLLGCLWILTPIDALLGLVWNVNPLTIMIKGILVFMRCMPEVLVRLPGYSLPVARPEISVIVLFYLVMFVVYRRVVRKREKDCYISGAIIAVLTVVIAVGNILSLGKMNLHFVNVGQGDGAVISIPMKETIIIDGGGSSEYSDYDYGESIFLPYLRREGYTKIDLAVVSHYHSDHVKGVIAAIEKLDVKEVLMPYCMENNKYRKEIENLARTKNIKLSYYEPGAKLTYPSGLTLSVIAPDKEDLKSENENDTSFGIKLSYGEFSALFTGDMSEEVEKNHLGEWGDVDLLKVAHHGSAKSSSEEFLNEVKPEIAVISVGENNSYNHPHKDVTDRLENICQDIFRTDLDGNIIVTTDKNGEYRIKKRED